MSITSAASNFNNAGTMNIGANSTFTVGGGNNYIQSGGLTYLQTTTSNLVAAATILNGGTLQGFGTVTGNLSNMSGTVHPGDGPGILTVTGSYSQASAGTLEYQRRRLQPRLGLLTARRERSVGNTRRHAEPEPGQHVPPHERRNLCHPDLERPHRDVFDDQRRAPRRRHLLGRLRPTQFHQRRGAHGHGSAGDPRAGFARDARDGVGGCGSDFRPQTPGKRGEALGLKKCGSKPAGESALELVPCQKEQHQERCAAIRLIKFAESLPDGEIVSTLSRQLSWSHFVEILQLKDPIQREFYAEMCRIERWNVRTRRAKIGGMFFERTALSRKPEEVIKQELANLRKGRTLTPDLVFRDPYFLDFLGLKDSYAEKDLEAAISREMERLAQSTSIPGPRSTLASPGWRPVRSSPARARVGSCEPSASP